MKRGICLLLIIVVSASLYACNTELDLNSEKAGTPLSATDPITQNKPQQVETISSSSDINIHWSKLSYTQDDADGYKYIITYHLSPWILLSNQDTLNFAWNEVGQQNDLPSFEDWGLNQSNDNYFRNNVPCLHRGGDEKGNFGPFDMTDMYYCLGMVTIKNCTEGWDITARNSRKVNTVLSWLLDDNTKYKWNSIGRVFYQNITHDELDGIYVSCQLRSNSVSIPFVIMAPEIYSPDYPRGKYYEKMLNGKFYASATGQQIEGQSIVAEMF